MTLENYCKEKERLSQALCGEQNLEQTINDIICLFEKHHINATPGIALDVVMHTLETLHLRKFSASTSER